MTYTMFRQAPAAKATRPLLIGLYSPKPGQGKTTTAHVLVESLLAIRGRKTMLRPFAAPLKLAACAFLEQACGLTDVAATKAIYDHKDSMLPGGFTGRDVLVWLGTMARENIAKDVWVRRCMEMADKDLGQGLNVIVDDVRLENEAEAITGRGGLLIRITRDGDLAGQTTATEGRLGDVPFTATLHNRGTLADLKRAVRALVKDIPR